jgi:hypothetical protein
MKKNKYILLFIITSANLLIGTFAFAQQKSVQYDKDFVFKDGVYITLLDFKNNDPIPTSKIIFKSNKGDRDYLKLALANATIKYTDSTGKEQEMKTDNLWGYCSNGTVYINHGTDFNRMVVIGSLCHFVATIATRMSNDPFGYGYGYGYGGFGYSPSPRYVYSTQQFILDFESGKIIDFNMDNMEILLQRDEVLHKEFVALKRKQKRDSIFLYLRKFNEKHPIYFPE